MSTTATNTAIAAYRDAVRANEAAKRAEATLERTLSDPDVDSTAYATATMAIDAAVDEVEQVADEAGWADSTRRQRVRQALHTAGRTS